MIQRPTTINLKEAISHLTRKIGNGNSSLDKIRADHQAHVKEISSLQSELKRVEKVCSWYYRTHIHLYRLCMILSENKHKKKEKASN